MAVQRFVQMAVLVLAGVFALLVVGRGLVYFTGDNSIVGQFSAEGPRGGCPQTDNCVSSYASEPPWAIDPIACAASPSDALTVFHDAVTGLGNVEVVTPGASYIAYSRLFRFPDDVRVDVSTRGLEVLSSSRLGAGDMGVNRSRVEDLRATITSDPRC